MKTCYFVLLLIMRAVCRGQVRGADPLAVLHRLGQLGQPGGWQHPLRRRVQGRFAKLD